MPRLAGVARAAAAARRRAPPRRDARDEDRLHDPQHRLPGRVPGRAFPRTNLPEELNNIDGLEYYNQINLLKGGILFADRVTTVSPRYAQEIQTPEFGCGLDGVVQTRAEDIKGLLNGIDTAVWNPAVDALLPARYSCRQHGRQGRLPDRPAQVAGFDVKFTGPIYGMVCRLAEQKGIDLLLANAEFLPAQNCRLIILGSGEKRYEEALQALAAARRSASRSARSTTRP
jgi:starch synthase